MQNHADRSREERTRAVANQPALKKKGGDTALQLVDNRRESVQLRMLQEMADHSPRAATTARLQAMADNSPRTVAQRQEMERRLGGPAQRQGAPEEDELQLKAEAAPVQRQSPEEDEPVQGEFSANEAPTQLESGPARQVNKTGLPDGLKSGVESLSGMSMDSVNVHYNSSKPAGLQALAYTQGTDIHVGPGQEKHLPHEAWHVVQQKQGQVKPTLRMAGTPVNDDRDLEREADVMGAKASSSASDIAPNTTIKRTPLLVQRQANETGTPVDAGAGLLALIEQLECLEAEATELGEVDSAAPPVSELSKILGELRTVSNGADEAAKAEVLAAINGELTESSDGAELAMADNPVGEATPVQKQPVQRLTGVEIALIVAGAVLVIGGIAAYVRKRRRDAAFLRAVRLAGWDNAHSGALLTAFNANAGGRNAAGWIAVSAAAVDDEVSTAAFARLAGWDDAHTAALLTAFKANAGGRGAPGWIAVAAAAVDDEVNTAAFARLAGWDDAHTAALLTAFKANAGGRNAAGWIVVAAAAVDDDASTATFARLSDWLDRGPTPNWNDVSTAALLTAFKANANGLTAHDWVRIAGFIQPKNNVVGATNLARTGPGVGPVPVAPAPFTAGNFAFASMSDGTPGSLYFGNMANHQRLRLTHSHGPEVGGSHAGSAWYFPVGKTWPREPHSRKADKTKAIINAWVHANAVPNVPTVGRSIIEFWGGNANTFSGRHPSRGTVAIPAITQADINVIYNEIAVNGANNAQLTHAIIVNNLSPWLQQ